MRIGMKLGLCTSYCRRFGGVGGIATPRRYWRIYTFRTAGDLSLWQICEIKFRTSAGGADLSTAGAVVSVDTTPQSGSAAQCIDGNTGTWCQLNGGATDHWFKIDWGAGNEKNINEILINGAVGDVSRSPGWFRVQYSDDDIHWTTAWEVHVTANPYTSTSTFVTFTRPTLKSTYRYYSLRMSDPGSTVNSLAELILAGSAGGSNLITSASMVDILSNSGESALVDGNSSTFAFTASNGSYERIIVDFGVGNEQNVKEIRLLPRQDGTYYQWARTYDILGSDDKSSWVPIWTANKVLNSATSNYTTFRNAQYVTDTSPNHRLWGIVVTSAQGAGLWGGKVQFRSTVGGARNTTGGIALGYNPYSTANLPLYGFDASANEYASASLPDTLAYDYGLGNEIAKPAQIALTARGSGLQSQTPTAFDLVWSDDGSTWTVQQSFTTPATWTSGETRLFTVN
jgi:hypothetical protein